MSHLLLFKSGSCILTVNTCSLHLHGCLAGSSEGPSPWHNDPRKGVRDVVLLSSDGRSRCPCTKLVEVSVESHSTVAGVSGD